MRRFCALAMVLLLSAAEANAEFRFKPLIYGSWSLYTIDDFEVAVGGDHSIIKGVCVTETINGKHKFAFATYPMEMNRGNDEYSGVVFAQATSPEWKFKLRSGRVKISSAAGPPLTIENALYDDDMIMFNLGGNGINPPEFSLFSALAYGEISLTSDTGKVLATFSSVGLRTAYPHLLDCGGIR